MERSLYETRPQQPAISRTVWALGFVSLCMDSSSELMHSRLPVFLVASLGACALAVGVIEGLAKLTKPRFPLAHSVETGFTARFLDRFVRRICAALFAAGRCGSHRHYCCYRGAYSLLRRLKVRPPHLVIS